MYPYCNCQSKNSSDCSYESTSESEDTYVVKECRRYQNYQKTDSCNCCEHKKKQKKLVKGKFGLAYVIETPKQTITQPTGWQVEFQDTPSKIENNCEAMMRWVNRPPLGECPTFSGYPEKCAALLREDNERMNLNQHCFSPKPDKRCYKNVQKQEDCSSSSDHECLCEKSTVNTRSPGRAASSKDGTYRDKFDQKDKNPAPICLCQEVFQKKHCCCIDPKCQYCQKEKHTNLFSKQTQQKKKTNFSHARDESDLDFLPKKDDPKKKTKNTQTKTIKVKHNDKPAKDEAKEPKIDKSIIHKIETKAIVDIRFAEKGFEIKNAETTQPSTLKRSDNNNEKKMVFNNDKKVKSSEVNPEVRNIGNFNFQKELEQKLLERMKKKEADQSKEIVGHVLEEIQDNVLETPKIPKKSIDNTKVQEKVGENSKTQEKVIENSKIPETMAEYPNLQEQVAVPKERQDTTQIIQNVNIDEDTKKNEYKMANYKHLPKHEIFTNDMTPKQKLKLALKIQKEEIQKSKMAQNQPPEKVIQTLDLQN